VECKSELLWLAESLAVEMLDARLNDETAGSEALADETTTELDKTACEVRLDEDPVMGAGPLEEWLADESDTDETLVDMLTSEIVELRLESKLDEA
jgi:hypothetical protein